MAKQTLADLALTLERYKILERRASAVRRQIAQLEKKVK